ncbi:MAG: hypothetical protein O7C72_01315 [Deltaproteobacteria bacterium]|nr:hypothetical protein [Deltaproteobacteria bacterium]
MKLYAFDVDETLEISGGPIKLDQMTQLRNEGHIVGICGNWIIFVQAVTGWHDLVSFLSIGIGEKSEFLNQIKQYIRAEEYIMVGNILGVSGASDDKGAAETAGWRFIKESEFAAGASA